MNINTLKIIVILQPFFVNTSIYAGLSGCKMFFLSYNLSYNLFTEVLMFMRFFKGCRIKTKNKLSYNL